MEFPITGGGGLPLFYNFFVGKKTLFWRKKQRWSEGEKMWRLHFSWGVGFGCRSQFIILDFQGLKQFRILDFQGLKFYQIRQKYFVLTILAKFWLPCDPLLPCWYWYKHLANSEGRHFPAVVDIMVSWKRTGIPFSKESAGQHLSNCEGRHFPAVMGFMGSGTKRRRTRTGRK